MIAFIAFASCFFNREKITYALLKAFLHVKHWWETYWEKNYTNESRIFGVEPTWDFFMDVFKEQYYPVGNYDVVLVHEMDHVASKVGTNSVEVHNYLPYLVHHAGYQRL
jgi:hypothetical protein